MIEDDTQNKELLDKSQENDKQSDNQQKDQHKQKKTKKKKKTKHKKHPPQYYEQKKLAKLLKKRQKQWDNRFIVQTIPSDFSKPRRAFSSHKTNLKYTKRLLSPKQTQSIYKTFHQDQQRKQKPSKSFNIRIVAKKQDRQSTAIVKKSQQNIKKQDPSSQKVKQEQQRNCLIQQVKKAYNESNFLKCHEQIMIDIIKKSKQKTISSYIHAQIARIKGKTSICINLQNLVNKREQSIKKLQQNSNAVSIQNVEEYRIATLRVIQEILKWREEIQKVYKQQTNVKPKISFTYEEQNYLLKICKGIKAQGKFKQFIQNPFLLGFENKIVENELLVKIRACQMLLLQQQLADS